MDSRDLTEGVRPWRSVIAAVVAGVLLGGVNSGSNVLGSAYGTYSLRPDEGVFFLNVLAGIIGTAWAWALVAFALGWRAPTMRLAPVVAILALAVATVVYYVSDYVFALNDELETGELTYWAVGSVAAGSVFGFLGHLARRPVRWSLLPGLVAPAAVVIFSYPTWTDQTGALDPVRPWIQLLAWIIATALTIAITSRWLRKPWSVDLVTH